MTAVGSPAETRDYILERLIGDTGEPERVTGVAKTLGDAAAAPFAQAVTAAFGIALDVEVRRVELVRFGEMRPDEASNSAMILATASASPDVVMMVTDASAVALLVSAVFGADPTMSVAPIKRTLSPLELEIVESVFQEMAAALGGSGPQALQLMTPLPAALTGAEIKKAVIRDAPAVQMVFGLSMPAGQGEISVVVPQRLLLKQAASGKAATPAAEAGAWGAHFGGEVMRSTVELVATMPVGQLTLGELSVLEVGQVIPLEETAVANAQLAARGKVLFACDFGKLGQSYTVRVRQPFDADRDLIDELLPS